jgi:hypothetical protein
MRVGSKNRTGAFARVLNASGPRLTGLLGSSVRQPGSVLTPVCYHAGIGYPDRRFEHGSALDAGFPPRPPPESPTIARVGPTASPTISPLRSPRAGARSTGAGARVVRWCSSSRTAAGPTRPARTPRPARAATTPGRRPRTGRSPNAVARAATARSRCGRVIRRPARSPPPRPWSRLTTVSTSSRRRDSSGGIPPLQSLPPVIQCLWFSASAVPEAWHPGHRTTSLSCRPRARERPASPPFAPPHARRSGRFCKVLQNDGVRERCGDRVIVL